MMREILPLALSLALLLAGCGGRSNVQLNSSTLPSGGVSSGGAVQVQGQSALGALLAIGVLVGASYASDRGMPQSAPALELDPSRRVLVQDCTKPIEDRSANLRCK
jgi:hypothetical protein